MSYIFLMAAIISEVISTTALRASEGFSRANPSILVIISEVITLYCLAIALKTIPIGTAYATWSGLSITLLSLTSILFYNEKIDLITIIGMILIITGICLINLFFKILE